VWCQGYSEPNSGSDLASLRTEAVDAGDHYVVNGQKTWTTLAGDANWIFLLVRTDKAAKKQEGSPSCWWTWPRRDHGAADRQPGDA
jgi:alkylation response protein AidB-like acyl-CoA dehydrogenase